jgi:hypothetical protein
MRNPVFSFVTAGLLTIAAAAPAGAQSVNMCIDRCFSNFSPMQNNGSTELRDECLQQCNRSSAPAAPVIPHGAIAFGARTASWGIAYGKASQAEAMRSAMARCRENGNDCQIANSYTNSCAAVAAVRSKAQYRIGEGHSLNEAKSGAVKACQFQLGGGCQLWVFTCAWDKN